LTYSSTQPGLHFFYDAEHRRLKKEVKGNGSTVDVTLFLYDNFKVIATIDGSGNLQKTFQWEREGPGGLLALTDHRSSPQQTHLAGYDGRGNLTTFSCREEEVHLFLFQQSMGPCQTKRTKLLSLVSLPFVIVWPWRYPRGRQPVNRPGPSGG
jgi:hypothetical protein